MNELVWLRSHVERCLQDVWEVFPIVVDDEGDYPFRYGTAAARISVVSTEDEHLVRVWACAARGVKRTAKLLSEVNEINARSRTAHVYWADGAVIVEQLVHADGLTRETIGQAYQAVGAVADGIGLLFAGMFAGSTPFPVAIEAPDEEAA